MSTRMKSSTLAVMGILALSIFAISSLQLISVPPTFRVFASPSDSLLSSQERVYKIREDSFPDVAKIVEVKNMQADDFPVSLEIVVKNLSDKNIYGISLGIHFIDAKVGGKTVGTLAYYGDDRLTNYTTQANPGEDFIPPGGTGIVKINKYTAMAFVLAIKQEMLPLADTYNIRIVFQTLNFGDGTGYLNKVLYPLKTSQTQMKLNIKERRLLSQLNVESENLAPFTIGKAFNSSSYISNQLFLGGSNGLLDFPLELMKEPSKSCFTCGWYYQQNDWICTWTNGCIPSTYTYVKHVWPGSYNAIYCTYPVPRITYDVNAETCVSVWCYEDEMTQCFPDWPEPWC